jgi:hypothetical protein
MSFFESIKNNEVKKEKRRKLTNRESSNPELTIEKTNYGTPINSNRDEDMLLAQLLEKEKLLGASINAFKNEEELQKKLPETNNQEEYIERNSRLGTLRNPITNYQNQIRDLLRDNGISPNNKPGIYNMYVEGRDVADEKYSKKRENALNDYLNDPNAFNINPILPSVDDMKNADNRRRDTLFGDFEEKSGQTSASRGMDALKNPGNLDPADIENIASNLEGSGASNPTPAPETTDEDVDGFETAEEETEPTPTPQRNPGGYVGDSVPTPQRNPGGYVGDSVPDPQRNPGGYVGDSVPDDTQEQAKKEQEEFSGVHPDPNVDIETSQTTNPFIETGKEADPPDASIFRSMIHVGTKISFDYLKKSSGYGDIIDLAEKFLPFELKDVVNSAINTLETTRTDEIGSLRASSKKRMKFNIEDKKHDMIHNPILYPFLVIALNFYMAKNEGDLIQFNWIMKQGIGYIMTNYLKLPSVNVDYFLNIYSSFPDSLNDAFIRNANGIDIVTEEEKREIKKFILTIITDYNSKFSPNQFIKDIQKYENGGLGLLNILENLANPNFLFEINKTFETVDNFIANVKDNKDILIGLMGLIYLEARNEGKLLNEAIISNAMIDGIVYYKKKINRKQKRDLDVELMIQMGKKPNERKLEGFNIKYNDDKLAEFENNQGDTTILFRGTNFREKDFLKKDFIQNVLNFAGSKEIFVNSEYNERYEKATQLILEKQREIENSGKGSLKVNGFSIGGIGAMYISILFPDIPVKVYSPVISNTQLTREMVQELVNRNSNIEFFAVEGDPISNNLGKFKDKLKITYIKKSKFFSAHSLENYLF